MPTLRSIGGTITEGSRVLVEGTGFTSGNLAIDIDGQRVIDQVVHSINDQGLDQQIVELTVPAGVSDGVIEVANTGGRVEMEAPLRMESVVGEASRGTPAHSTIASANTGQVIVLRGQALEPTDQVVFTSVDPNGHFATTAVAATSVAPDGSSLEVLVPIDATTGAVRLKTEAVGEFL